MMRSGFGEVIIVVVAIAGRAVVERQTEGEAKDLSVLSRGNYVGGTQGCQTHSLPYTHPHLRPTTKGGGHLLTEWTEAAFH